MKLTLEAVRAAKIITYEVDGHGSSEELLPVRWEDSGALAWQAAVGRHLCGFWWREGQHTGAFERSGTFEVVKATPDHLTMLEEHCVPHRGNTVIVVDGVRFEGDYDARNDASILVTKEGHAT